MKNQNKTSSSNSYTSNNSSSSSSNNSSSNSQYTNKQAINTYEMTRLLNRMMNNSNQKYTDGSLYKGQLKNGKRDGWGIHKFPNGDWYLGQWNNNEMYGKGLYLDMTNKFFYTGFFSGSSVSALIKYNKYGEQDNANSTNQQRKLLYKYEDDNHILVENQTSDGLGLMVDDRGKIVFGKAGTPSQGIIEGIYFQMGENGWYTFRKNNYGEVMKIEEYKKDNTILQAIVGGALIVGGIAAIINSSSNSSTSTSSSSNTSSNSSAFISCSRTTSNSIDLYVLAVGTDANILSDKDAVALTNRLKQGCGERDLFGNVYTITLTGQSATKSKILNAFYEIRRKTNEDDIFLLYFSGHGCGKRSGCDEFAFVTSKPEQAFITVDEIVEGINADNCKTIFWFDACMAGQVAIDFRDGVDDYIRSKTLPNVSILMSSSDSESSWPDTNNNLGFFTKAIIDGLNGAADYNNNRIVSLEELCRYVISVVPQRTNNCTYCTNTQHPRQLKAGRDAFNTRLSKY